MGYIKSILSSKAGPGLLFAILIAVLIPFAKSETAYIVGAGLGNMTDPLILVTTVFALFKSGKWYTPLAIMIVGVAIALMLRGDSLYSSTTSRFADGIAAVIVGCVFASIAHGLYVAVSRFRRPSAGVQ